MKKKILAVLTAVMVFGIVTAVSSELIVATDEITVSENDVAEYEYTDEEVIEVDDEIMVFESVDNMVTATATDDEDDELYNSLYTKFYNDRRFHVGNSDELFRECFDMKWKDIKNSYKTALKKKWATEETFIDYCYDYKEYLPIDYMTAEVNVYYDQDFARNELLQTIQAWRRDPSNWWTLREGKRVEAKYSPLEVTYDYYLEKKAMERAAEIAVYFKHDDLKGGKKDLLYHKLGENIDEEPVIIGQSKQSLADDIMFSFAEDGSVADANYKPHRESFLEGCYDRIGIGVCHNGYAWYVVVLFGTTDGSVMQRSNW